MENDVVGINSVATLIESSGKSKFIIRRSGAVKSAPVWEYSGSSPGKARQEFINWANTLMASGKNCNSYSITLFNEVEEEEGTRKGKSEKPFVFTFALSKEEGMNYYEDRSGKKDPQHISEILTAMELKFQAMLKEKEESEISKRLKEIEERLNEEEEQEGINGNEQPSELMNILGTIAGLVSGNKAQPSAINGTNPLNEDRIKSINSSIKRLYAIDPQLDEDLRILAEMGEKNPKQFQFLLNTLRNM